MLKEAEIRKREVFNRYLEMVSEDARCFFQPQTFRVIACPACGMTEHEFAFEKAGFTYVVCPTCRTLYVNPRPSGEELKRFYAQSPSACFWVEEFFKPVAEVRRLKIFRPRAEYVRDRFPVLTQRVIADIGSGFGLFLDELRKMRPDNRYIAIEPSPAMVRICRESGFEVIEDFVEDIGRAWDKKVFLITAFELFEHLAAPRAFLEKIYNLLEPGGYLLLTTLNGEGFDIQVLWDKSKSVFPPHHLNFFNLSSMHQLLHEVGFRIEELCTPGQLDWDIVEGSYLQEGISLGRFWTFLAECGDDNVKRTFQDWLVASKLSSHMRVLVQKPCGPY